MAENFSVALADELNSHKEALPAKFNIERYVQNAVALLNGNESLMKYAQQYGTSQIKLGLMRAACQNLDALSGEIYLIPFGSQLTYMPSFKGMVKMVKLYSERKVKDVYSRCVREGDEFEEVIINGQSSINYKAKPFNNGNIIGVFAVALFEDGGMIYETMSADEVEKCRKQSKAQNSPAWKSFFSEMARKTVVRRLCKNITLNMDKDSLDFFNSGTEIETDVAEISKREIEDNANQEELIIESDDVDEVFEP